MPQKLQKACSEKPPFHSVLKHLALLLRNCAISFVNMLPELPNDVQAYADILLFFR